MLVYFLVLILTIYALAIFALPPRKKSTNLSTRSIDSTLDISLVVPFRNESRNISVLLNTISKLDYPTDQLEVVFVNDHSLDSSPHLVEKFLNQIPFRTKLVNLSESKGKKAALTEGIVQSANEIIITTDADCELAVDWIKIYSEEFQKTSATFISAPVLIRTEKSLLNGLQQIDQCILMQLTSSYIKGNRAIMANAANMAFLKEVFKKEYLLEEKSLSGDDVFLVHSLKKQNEKLHFIDHTNASVYTQGERNLFKLISQRLRWASKSKYYRDIDSLFCGVAILITNVLLIALLILVIMQEVDLSKLLYFFLMKTLLDLVLLYRGRRYLIDRSALLYLPFYIVLYPVYTISIALLSLLYKPMWKGRPV